MNSSAVGVGRPGSRCRRPHRRGGDVAQGRTQATLGAKHDNRPDERQAATDPLPLDQDLLEDQQRGHGDDKGMQLQYAG